MKKRLIVFLTLSAILLSACGKERLVNPESIAIEPVSEEIQPIESQSLENNTSKEDSYETEPVVVEEEESPKTVSLVMVGDILLHTPIEEGALADDGSRDYSSLFANMKDEIETADIAIVNEEVIIGGAELGVSGYPAFNAPFEVGDELVETGFDVILHATNHALDKGKKGIINCIDFWENNYPDITMIGINDSQEDSEKINILDVNDIKVAILNYTYGTNGIEMPADMPFAVNMMDKDKMKKDIERAKELADFVIVCPHWGTEYLLEISSYQEDMNRFFFENGVNLVLGTHPHVIEPIKEYVDEETGFKMVTYYSLGNYVNWTSGTGAGVSNRMVGGMAEVTLEKNDENVTIANYGVEALVAHVEKGFNRVTVYPLNEYSEELAAKNEIISQAPDFSYDYCVELCNKVWGNMYR